MLRITTVSERGCLTFRLEGRLAGPWVRELQECVGAACARGAGGPTAPPEFDASSSGVRLDLTGVTSIDAAGKDYLAAAHARGAELIAAGCLMRALVAEIKGAALARSESRKSDPS